MITATFSIILTGEFLPIQLIYGGKTKKIIPAVSYPSDFVISANKKTLYQREGSIKYLRKRHYTVR